MTHIADSETNAPDSHAIATGKVQISSETIRASSTGDAPMNFGMGIESIVDESPNGEVLQPTPYPTRLHDRVAICGFAEGHRDSAPWAEDDIEFWGINRLWSVLEKKPWHRWFELHSLEDFYVEDNEHRIWLQQLGIPIYVRPQDLETAAEWEIPNATPYPVDRVLNDYTPYFTNTISWLLALAISMGYKEVQLFGVDMAQDSVMAAEYSQQRPSCEWLIGYAQASGIDIILPPGSDLMKTSHLYGFSSDAYQQKLLARAQEIAQRKENIRGEMNQHAQQAEFLKYRISELDGALQECTYNLRNLVTQGDLHGT